MATISVEANEADAGGWWQRADGWLSAGSEYLNPILVKEARQALKSRQFVVTFGLLLFCGWGWSLLGVAFNSPGIYFAASGVAMLAGYYVVLAVPLLIVVPFIAYRSLAAEQDDGTYELLSITSLTSRQIVTGKLGSAVLQMVVYTSALAPCIVFTYLLRGIDIISILLMLSYTMLVSLALCGVGLFCATLTRVRHWQILISVIFLGGLLLLSYIWIAFLIVEILFDGLGWFTNEYSSSGFWVAQLAILSFGISTFVMVIMAAAAGITFKSENRSTKLRYMMLVQQVLWVGWAVYLMCSEPHYPNDAIIAIISCAGVYWFLMGALMTGEDARLSPRVRRSLPQSALGRAFFTCFNPGSGTGYLFAVGSFAAVCFSVSIAAFGLATARDIGFSNFTGRANYASFNAWSLLQFSLLACAFLAGYLGLGRLIIVALRKRFEFGLALPVLTHVFFAVIGVAIPMFLHAWLSPYGGRQYSALHITNWGWTLERAAEEQMFDVHWMMSLVILAVGGGLFVVNLLVATREITQQRLATPARIVADERELHPERFVEPRQPKNPWDDEDDAEPQQP